MNFTFPKTKFVDENSIYQQVSHLASECEEVLDSVVIPNIYHTAEEIFDMIHSGETALRILAEKYAVNLDQVHSRVVNKNAARGYYQTKIS